MNSGFYGKLTSPVLACGCNLETGDECPELRQLHEQTGPKGAWSRHDLNPSQLHQRRVEHVRRNLQRSS